MSSVKLPVAVRRSFCKFFSVKKFNNNRSGIQRPFSLDPGKSLTVRLTGWLAVLTLLFCGSSKAQGFLRTSDKNIVNENGENVLLRAINLGGWMLQEGYMLQTSSFANPQHEIEAKIEALIGKENKDLFYESWLNNFCRKVDIDSLAAWGFNAIRLPMHYKLFTLPIEQELPNQNTWLEKGFELTDNLLDWCEANRMVLILDLHAAPGGQGQDAAISDYDDTKPSLWESPLNRNKTVALWRKLAERYVDEPWIGGYDLINEPNWNLSGNTMLRTLYQDITEAIRKVDNNHIIFVEGNWFANDFNGLTPPWDDNMVYSFHKYWSHNDNGSIAWMLQIRNQHNIPIWCGESGENSNHWFTQAIALFESHNIGWAWWPHKKVGSASCPLSIVKLDAYQRLLDYWEGRGIKPSTQAAKNALFALAEGTRFENCVFQKDVIDAMFRQVQSTRTLPFAPNEIPGHIEAVNYDLGIHNQAYHDNDIADYRVSTGTWSPWNRGWLYRNDGVDIEASEDNGDLPYNVGWIEDGEWLKYTLRATQTDNYILSLRIAGTNTGGQVLLKLDDKSLTESITLPNTGGWQAWRSVELGQFEIDEGEHYLKIHFVRGGINFSRIEFKGTKTVTTSASFQIKQNHPNPFPESTKIPFNLSESASVRITIFDVAGRVVRNLTKKMFTEGDHFISWDGCDNSGNALGSGVYFCRVTAGDQEKVKRMVLLR